MVVDDWYTTTAAAAVVAAVLMLNAQCLLLHRCFRIHMVLGRERGEEVGKGGGGLLCIDVGYATVRLMSDGMFVEGDWWSE